MLCHLSGARTPGTSPATDSARLRRLLQVGLLVIDEIHLLGADRGPILEVIVSRMRYIAAQVGGPGWGVSGGGWVGLLWVGVPSQAPQLLPAPLPIAPPCRPRGTTALSHPSTSNIPIPAPFCADRAGHPFCGTIHRPSQRSGLGRLAWHHGAGAQPLALLPSLPRAAPSLLLVTLGVPSCLNPARPCCCCCCPAHAVHSNRFGCVGCGRRVCSTSSPACAPCRSSATSRCG